MVAVPAVAPAVTTPVLPTLAMVALLLLHTPPPVASASVLVAPVHAYKVPVIAAGDALTVTVARAVQPDAIVYVIVAVPADTPVSAPVAAFMVATPVLLLLHVPPGVVLPSVTV